MDSKWVTYGDISQRSFTTWGFGEESGKGTEQEQIEWHTEDREDDQKSGVAREQQSDVLNVRSPYYGMLLNNLWMHKLLNCSRCALCSGSCAQSDTSQRGTTCRFEFG